MVVVFAHLGYAPLTSPAGLAAVQAFFMISGFYIAMVLDTSYQGSTRSFWINRALRLYPAYMFVAVVALAFRLLADPGFAAGFHALPGAARLLLWLSNATIFGQDWVMFMGVQGGHLTPVDSYVKSDPQLWTFLLIPPAWSLGVELTFYAIAPFLLKLRTRHLVAFVGASLVVRAALAAMGLHQDPWANRFFPSEVAVFLAGSIAYRMRSTLRSAAPWLLARGRDAIVLITAFVVVYAAVPGPEGAKRALLLIVLALSLPAIFLHSKDNRADRYIGDLSYPLYISHWTTLAIAAHFFGGKPMTLPAAIGTALVCVVVSVVLRTAIDSPVQRVRARFRNTGARPDEVLQAAPAS